VTINIVYSKQNGSLQYKWSEKTRYIIQIIRFFFNELTLLRKHSDRPTRLTKVESSQCECVPNTFTFYRPIITRYPAGDELWCTSEKRKNFHCTQQTRPASGIIVIIWLRSRNHNGEEIKTNGERWAAESPTPSWLGASARKYCERVPSHTHTQSWKNTYFLRQWCISGASQPVSVRAQVRQQQTNRSVPGKRRWRRLDPGNLPPIVTAGPLHVCSTGWDSIFQKKAKNEH